MKFFRSHKISILYFGVGAIAILSFFQNCQAPVVSHQVIYEPQVIPFEKIRLEMTKDLDGDEEQIKESLTQLCSQSNQYLCTIRNFSTEIEDSISDERTDCFSMPLERNGMESEGEVCVRVLYFEIPSRSGFEACEECTMDDLRRYNYNEVTCYHQGITDQGRFPIEGEGSSLREAFEKSQDLCLKLVE